jgi:hypothetical protein
VVKHLNAALPAITEDERLPAVRLNMSVAESMRRTAHWDGALRHARIARSLLPPRAWDCATELWEAVTELNGELEYIAGDTDVARAVLDDMIDRHPDPLVRGRVVVTRVMQLHLQHRFADAVEKARFGLALFGVSLNTDNCEEAVGMKLTDVDRLLGERGLSFDALDKQLSPMTDPVQRLVMRLMLVLCPVCYRGFQALWALLVTKIVKRTILHGLMPGCGYAFACELQRSVAQRRRAD